MLNEFKLFAAVNESVNNTALYENNTTPAKDNNINTNDRQPHNMLMMNMQSVSPASGHGVLISREQSSQSHSFKILFITFFHIEFFPVLLALPENVPECSSTHAPISKSANNSPPFYTVYNFLLTCKKIREPRVCWNCNQRQNG